MTNLRDEVRGKIEKEFNDLYMGLDVDAAVTTTEIFQAIVRALPKKQKAIGLYISPYKYGQNRCLADIKKLLDTKK